MPLEGHVEPERLGIEQAGNLRPEAVFLLQFPGQGAVAAIRILDYIDNAGREFPDLNLRGMIAVSNPIKLGFKIVGILRIKVDINKIESVTKELSKLKSIWFVVLATGDSDIYTEFVAKSLDELNDVIFNKIYKINGVVRTETSLILKYIKRRYDWGTA